MRTKGLTAKFVCLLFVLLLSCGTAVACGGHAHSYADTWEYNTESHWHPSTCGHKNVGKNVGAHEFTAQVVSTCDGVGYTVYSCVCGYSRVENDQNAGHVWASDWSTDAQNHWHSATCAHNTLVKDKGAHDFEDTVFVPCTEDGYTLHTCKTCGYTYTDARVAATGGNHVYDTEHWSSDATAHWHAKRCGCALQDNNASNGYAVHTMVENGQPATLFEAGYTDASCSVCGYTTGRVNQEAMLAMELLSDGSGYKVRRGSGLTVDTVEIPAEYKGLPVKALDARLFQDETILKSLTIPSFVTEIPALLCKGCTELTTVSLPGSITKVGLSAFNGCTKLEGVSLSGVKQIDEYAFKGAGLKSLTLPATLVQMKAQAFTGCAELTTLQCAAPMLGESAFDGCVKLGTVSLTGTVNIASKAFYGCTALTALTLPDTVMHVGKEAFKNSGLAADTTSTVGVTYVADVVTEVNAASADATVALKAGTVGIAEEAFFGNTTITTLTAVDTLRFVSANALRDCTNLTGTFTAPTGLKEIGYSAFRNTKLTAVELGTQVENVGDFAFFDCHSLASATLAAKHIGNFAFSATGKALPAPSNDPTAAQDEPATPMSLTTLTLNEGVESIGSSAFRYGKFTTLTLPSTLTSIGMYAFANNTDLTAVSGLTDAVTVGENVFYGCTAYTPAA